MKANELRQQNADNLQRQLLDLRKEEFNLRMQQGTGQLTRPSRMREVRRDIARVKTVMTEISSMGTRGRLSAGAVSSPSASPAATKATSDELAVAGSSK